MEHWKRFSNERKYSDSMENSCHGCPHGTIVQAGERLKYPELYKNHPQYRNGRLYHDEYAPNANNDPCNACYKEWLEEKQAAGKICRGCNCWIQRKKAGMQIIADNIFKNRKFNYKTISAFCEPCTNRMIEGALKKKEATQ